MLPAALLALIPLAAILRPGMPLTADGEVHLYRTFEAARLLGGGVLYPRWAPDFYNGYGYPFFNFYAPGVHVIGALLSMLGLGVARAVVAVQGLALLLYPAGAYLLAREFYAPTREGGERPAPALPAMLAAALYLFAPLRFRELFVQGNLSQLVALAWLAWAAWLLTRLAARPSPRRMAAAALGLAGLIYLHHASAFVALPLLALYAALLAWLWPGVRGGRFRALAWGAAAFLLAVVLSAPFALPATLELPYSNIDAIEAGMFNVRLNLVPIADLLAPTPRLDLTAANPPMPNNLGQAQIGAALLGLLAALGALRRRGVQRGMGFALLGVAGLLLLSLALMSPVSGPAWDALPLARFIAFPWRLLGPALLFAALLGAAPLAALPLRAQPPVLGLATVAVILLAAPYLFPRPFAPVSEPSTAGLWEYERRSGARGTASANEYLPRWAADPNPPPLAEPGVWLPAMLPGGGSAQPLGRSPLAQEYRVKLAPLGAAQVVLSQFYFPGWSARVDGQPVDVVPAGPHGLLAVSLPAGEHDLQVRYAGTPLQHGSEAAGLIGLLLSVLLILWRKPQPALAAAERASPYSRETRPALLFAALLALLAVLKIGLVEPYSGWFRLQSSVERPAGMEHETAAGFEGGIELLGYSLRRQEVTQGDALAVRLFWRTRTPLQADYRPYLHLDSPDGSATFANETKANAAGKPSSTWPTGFYLVDDYLLEVPSATPPLVATLRAGLLRPDGSSLPLAGGGDQVELARVRVREGAPLQAAGLPGADQAYRVGELRLVGHDVRCESTGAACDVTLYWQAPPESSSRENYQVFVHLLDEAGQVVAQRDGPPVHGWYPTGEWLPGQVVQDTRRVEIPPGASRPRGVAAGMYRPSDLARLPVTDALGTPQPANRILFPLP